MEQTENTSHQAATYEPVFPSTLDRAVAEQLSEQLIENARDTGNATNRPGWTQRVDGWTPERITLFLKTLSQSGVVADAARAAGMSKQSAYAFRNSARGRGFDVAWRAAQLIARRQLADELMSRAVNGCVDVVMRDGKVLGQRHRFDNRLAMALLTRLDRLAASEDQADEAPRLAAEEFDAFVASVCAGAQGVADFVRSRAELPEQAFDEEHIITRNEDFALHSSPSLLGEGDREAVEGPSPAVAGEGEHQHSGGGALPVDADQSQPSGEATQSTPHPFPGTWPAHDFAPPPYNSRRAQRRRRAAGRKDDHYEDPNSVANLSDEELSARLNALLPRIVDLDLLGGVDPSKVRTRSSQASPFPAGSGAQWQPSTSATSSLSSPAHAVDGTTAPEAPSSPAVAGEGDHPQGGGGGPSSPEISAPTRSALDRRPPRYRHEPGPDSWTA